MPFREICGHFEDQVFVGEPFEFGELAEHVDREPAAAGAQFEYRRAAERIEDFRALPGDDPAEQRRQLRRRDEIAGRAEFRGAGCVVAEPGGVQRVVHELGEADRAPGFADALADERGTNRAVLGAFAFEFWKSAGSRGLHVDTRVAENGAPVARILARIVTIARPDAYAGLRVARIRQPKDPSMPRTLEGNVALVTGAARRIGARIVETLHEAGAHAAVHYRGSSAEADALVARLNGLRDDSAAAFQADLLDTPALPGLVERVLDWGGRLDVLVNNASTFYPTPIGEITEAHWNDLVGINLKAPLFLTQAAAPALRETRGSIVNIVDIHSTRPLTGHLVYGPAKAGLAMLTRGLAKDLGPDIRVNGVSPGAILWPEGGMSDDTKQAILDQVPLGRPGDPADIAGCVLYLVRDADYVTGQIVAVDGGRSVGW